MNRMTKLSITLLALAAAGVASFYGFFFFRDNFSTHYPMKYVSATAFRAGEIPYWNPSDGGGQPLAGNPNALTFYPDNVLYLFLPAHMAFNLHFLLHLALAWFAMRALADSLLSRGHDGEQELVKRAGHDSARFAAWLYVLSGAVITACAFYNLIVAAALIPLAFLGIERRSAALLGISFGLMGLAAEPVTILGCAAGCAILASDRRAWLKAIAATPLALLIASPQLIAYSEIAREVERARGFSATTILNASLEPYRVVELMLGPLFRGGQPHLFLSLFIGLIAIPAMVRKSRYAVVACALLFFALGRFNPIAAAILPHLRVARYPEKLILPVVVAICALAALCFAASTRKRMWLIVTFVPSLAWAILTLPVDWFAPYVGGAPGAMRVEEPWHPGGRRVQVPFRTGGQTLSRSDYRARAADREPLFGVTQNLQYVLNRSGDSMHSLLSRVAVERYADTKNPAYVRIVSAPPAFVVPRARGVRSVQEAVARIEHGERGIAPMSLDGFVSPATGKIDRYAEGPESIRLTVTAPANMLVFVNQSYFDAWVALSDGRELRTMPLDLDRLGVVVPAGAHEVLLRFGRHRTSVMLAWIASWLAVITALVVSTGFRSAVATVGVLSES
jgi:hypothetical protein